MYQWETRTTVLEKKLVLFLLDLASLLHLLDLSSGEKRRRTKKVCIFYHIHQYYFGKFFQYIKHAFFVQCVLRSRAYDQISSEKQVKISNTW